MTIIWVLIAAVAEAQNERIGQFGWVGLGWPGPRGMTPGCYCRGELMREAVSSADRGPRVLGPADK